MRRQQILSVIAVLAISFFSVVESGGELGCVYTGPSGNYYDLSLLSNCDNSGYDVSSPSDGDFFINICNTVSGCSSSAAVCQSGGFNCGQASSLSFSELSGGKGVILTYSNGDGCPNGKNRQTIISFTCDPNAQNPVITFTSENPECVYNFVASSKEACPKPKGPQIQQCFIDVYLVPHTHDDVGWLMTVDGYYQSQVKHILDTSVQALVDNPQRKFIYVEQAYFTRWWYDPNTSDQQRQQLRNIVKSGQFEFVLGGWVMPDEAATTYGGIIDQLTLGHQFLLNTFDYTPTKGWQIDPFGASSVTPVLYKLAGFDGHIIDRITDKDAYQNQQKLDFLWRGSPSLGQKGELFTEILGDGGYCDWYFQFQFDNDPVNPNNVADYGKKFASFTNGRTNWYKTPNVLAEWGCDFGFQNAHNMFNSMDKVVDWLKQNEQSTGIRVKYTTLSEYFAAVQNYSKTKNVQWPVDEGGDYFTYFASLWWTGYFTSRVELKGFVRAGEAASHIAEPIYAMGRLTAGLNNQQNNDIYANLTVLREANGDAQHHDGVTGTSVPEVVQMYKDHLIIGINSALQGSGTVLGQLIKKSTSSPTPNLVVGPSVATNIRPGQVAAVVVNNGLGWTRSEVVSIPVQGKTYNVFDSRGMQLATQVIPFLGGNASAANQLFFQATDVPPLGFNTYFVVAVSETEQSSFQKGELQPADQDVLMENSIYVINISAVTGRISNIRNKISGLSVSVDQNLYSYVSKQSGAYAFTPIGPASPFVNNNPTNMVFNSGSVFSEVFSTFNNYGKQYVRLYKNSNPNTTDVDGIEDYIEIGFDVGTLPSHIEVVSRFSTSIDNGNNFATDANGYQFLQRQYNFVNGIGSNFYPMVYGSYIKDGVAQLSLVSERSHGASSVDNGQLEVMIHRNPDMGDGFGPGLTDTTEVFPSLRILVDAPEDSMASIHSHSYLMNFPVSLYSANTQSPTAWLTNYKPSGKLLSADLPANIHLQSLSALDPTATVSKVVLRLAHIYATGEDPDYSHPVTLNFAALFSQFTIESVAETTISANKVIAPATSTVTINPAEIRTFVISFSHN